MIVDLQFGSSDVSQAATHGTPVGLFAASRLCPRRFADRGYRTLHCQPGFECEKILLVT